MFDPEIVVEFRNDLFREPNHDLVDLQLMVDAWSKYGCYGANSDLLGEPLHDLVHLQLRVDAWSRYGC